MILSTEEEAEAFVSEVLNLLPTSLPIGNASKTKFYNILVYLIYIILEDSKETKKETNKERILLRNIPKKETKKEIKKSNQDITPRNQRVNQLVKRKSNPPTLPFPCPKTVEPFIEYWEYKRNVTLNRTTKVFKDSVIKLKMLVTGTLFDNVKGLVKYSDQTFTIDQFKQSVDNFYLRLLPEYEPSKAEVKKGYKSLNLSDFLLNVYTANPSKFIYNLEYAPKKIKQYTSKHSDPKLTDCLIELFGKVILEVDEYEPVIQSRQIFEDAATKLKTFLTKNHDYITDPMLLNSQYSQAEALVDCVSKDTVTFQITPGFLRSERTFTRFEEYLIEHDILSDVPLSELQEERD